MNSNISLSDKNTAMITWHFENTFESTDSMIKNYFTGNVFSTQNSAVLCC